MSKKVNGIYEKEKIMKTTKTRALNILIINVIILAILSVCAFFVSCKKHEHSYLDNFTCHDRICECGETINASTLHKFTDSYSCHDKVCSICGDTVPATTEHAILASTACYETNCLVCGDLVTSKVAHTYGEFHVLEEPTCVKDGTRGSICSVCGHVELEKFEQFGHDFNDQGVCRNGCNVHLLDKEDHTEHVYSKDYKCADKRCLVCGEIAKAEDAHVYTNKTDCSEKVCLLCGSVAKNNKAHSIDYDCRESLCKQCGEPVRATTDHEFSALGVCECGYYSIEEEFSFVRVANGYAVSGYEGNKDFVAIPEKYQGLNVVEVADRAFLNSAVKGVYVPKTVTKIGYRAFYNSRNLQEVAFSVYPIVNQVREGAFGGCVNLESILLPRYIKELPLETFKGCAKLTYVKLPDMLESIGSSAFNGCGALGKLQIPEGVSKIESAAFKNCYSLGVVKIDEDSRITEIKPETFYNCSKLYSIELPKTTVYMGRNAFYNCNSLIDVTIPASVKQLDSLAFAGCNKLIHVRNLTNFELTFNNSDCEILTDEKSTFESEIIYNSDGVVELSFNNKRYILGYIGGETALDLSEDYSNVYAIYPYAFYNLSITSIEIPSSVEVIGDCAFKNCYLLNKVSVNSHSLLSEICTQAFSGCGMLVEITVPKNVTEIGSLAFFGCYRLVNIRNLSTVELSGVDNPCMQIIANETDAFDNQIVIDEQNQITVLVSGERRYLLKYDGFATHLNLSVLNITDIYDQAFDCDENLKQITLPETLVSIGSKAFRGCTGIESITIPASVTKIGDFAFADCSNLTAIHFAQNSNLNKIANGAFEFCIKLDSLVIPSSVTEIGVRAFYGCKAVSSLQFESNSKLETVKDSAFFGCETIEQLNLPASVKTVGDNAFYGCKSLVNFKFGNGFDAKIENIGERAFMECNKISILDFGKYNKLKVIGKEAFTTCSEATVIILPVNIEFVYMDAFAGCSKIEKFYYGGTHEDLIKLDDNDHTNGEFYKNNITVLQSTVKRFYYSETPLDPAYNFWKYDVNGDIVEL